MNDKDKKHFGELMAMLGEVFQKEISKPLLRIYFLSLQDFNIREIEKAVSKIIGTRKITGTIPLPAEIREAACGSLDDRAQIAWTALLWAIEHVGHMASVQFEDPIIHDTVRAMGGWIRVCSADGDVYNEEWHTKNLQWRRKDFIGMYKSMAEQDGKLLPYLIGMQEAENKGIYDDFIPRLTRIAGKPGQYVALPGIRQKELPAPEDKISEIVNEVTKRNNF